MSAKIIIFLAALLSVCGYTAHAQFVYIDKFYDSGLTVNQSEGIWGNSLHELVDGFLFASFTMNNLTGIAGTWLIKTDLNGDTLWTKNYVDTAYSETPQNMIYTSEGNYVIASSFRIVNSNNPYDPSLTKITPSGEIIWKQTYGSDTLYENINNVIQTNDGGYAIIASRGFSSQADAYLIKTDSAGTQQWEQQYGGGGYEAGKSILQTPDNGFMLLGWTRSFGNGQRDWYLLKTDSVGNEEWYETYGNNEEDVAWRLIKLYDSNYLLAGGGGVNGRLIKVNPLGDIIWQKNYQHPNGNGGNFLFDVKELENGNIIAIGGTNNSSQSDAAWLLKTDSAGNELWQRRYNKSNEPDLFYALLPSSAGGFLLGGQAGNTANNNNQDAWLLKVDSMGCTYPNCTVGIDENDKTKVVADIYPNPASEVLNIEFQNAEDWLVTLIDINGKVVFTATNNQTLLSIDISSFASGVYALQLLSELSLVNKKIVVQNE